ncbi:MAG: EAL domain-containing protein [Treponema sp.]|nr:EAL domain-containing protein [Treponema sp.]
MFSLNLPYYVLGEVITCLLCLVLSVNILTSFSTSEYRHRLFLYADLSTFFAAFINIASVICIAYYKHLPLGVATGVSTLYFIFLLMPPLFLSSYALDMALPQSIKKIGIILNYLIYTVYLIIILLNIKTGWVFHYDSQLGYIRGPLKTITYITTVIYGAITIISLTLNRNAMAKRVYVVFLLYPLLSMLIMSFQFFLPKVILTGTASFAALLLTYVSIQSDLLDFDMLTGLMTGKKLIKHIENNNKKGFLYVLSIENMNILQNNMEISDLNLLLLDIGRHIQKCFLRYSYHQNTSRFAGICNNLEELKAYHKEISDYINTKNLSTENKILIPMDVYYSAVEIHNGDKNSDSLIDIINNLLSKAIMDEDHTLRICNQEVLESMERKRQIAEILKRELTLESKQFQVWFQPIFSLQKKAFTHMEALSRLQNTELGDIPPQEFVEVAENKGLIEKLGFVAFEKVCKYIADNKDLVKSISINFSVYQMVNQNVVASVLKTISNFGLTPSSIIIEITESLFIENYALVRDNMIALAKAGVRFYLDDFGTGYSNLSSVLNLPFSTIKIDRSLMLVMEDDDNKQRFVCNIIDTFKDAGVKVLVEGVETQSQNNMVKNTRADYIQGFFYSKPLPADKCIEVLKNQSVNKE